MEKPIEGFENYVINDLGEVYSLPKRTRKGRRKMKPMQYKHGYICVDLVKDTKVYRKLIHRIVATAFLPNPENKPQVNHINGIKSDNNLNNLEWNTHSENQKHSIKIGLRSAKGIKNSQSKLTEDDIRQIRKLDLKYAEIAKMFNIGVPNVCSIKKNKTWTHVI
jgi:hypothetical protein